MATGYYNCPSCSASIKVRTAKNRAETDNYCEWLESQGRVCAECDEKRRAEENAKAAQQNLQTGLAPLSGTEKQIAWAETIRLDKLARAHKIATLIGLLRSCDYLESLSESDRSEIKVAVGRELEHYDINERILLQSQLPYLMRAVISTERYAALITILKNQTRASWWIDHRQATMDAIANELRTDIDSAIEAAKPMAPAQEKAMQAAQEEALLKPTAAPLSTQIAEITLIGKELRVSFPEKNEAFRLLMRGMGFRWADRHWLRMMGLTTGNPIDRIAETAHHIIGAGFMARLHDDEARDKAISGQFDPEQTRWVTKQVGGTYDGWCRIQWPKSDDLYGAAKRLLGARYKDGGVYVPPGSILEVADFAVHYGFSMSPGAQQTLEVHRAALANGVVITEPKKPKAAIIANGNIPHLIAETVEIDNELKD